MCNSKSEVEALEDGEQAGAIWCANLVNNMIVFAALVWRDAGEEFVAWS